MTGLIDGLRSWFGALLGDDSDDPSDDRASEPTAEAPPAAGGDAPSVVHRDDRPLETPTNLDPSPPSDATSSTDEAERDHRERVEIPDAEGDVNSAGDVSIPDAETGAGSSAGAPEDEVAVADAESSAGSATGETGDGSADRADAPPVADTTDPDDAASDGFVCSVCGTAVDDAEAGCPLCGSTDVRPESTPDDGSDSPRGRTAVAATDDDAAVDRLRDVRENG
jgi:hypothetical protein